MRALLVLTVVSAFLGFAQQTRSGRSPYVRVNPAQTLLSDPSEEARIEAARLLAEFSSQGTIEVLQTAVKSEKQPQVVDAIVSALERAGAPVVAPQMCWEVVGRCWEASVAKPLFDRWRASASAQDVLEAATHGPVILQALALQSLAGDNAKLDAGMRNRLIRSALNVYAAKEGMAPSTDKILTETLWGLTGHDMGTLLKDADDVQPASAAYNVSYQIAARWPDAYYEYRRPRQFLAALLAALLFTPLLVSRRFRHAGIVLSGSMVAWGLWTLICRDVRELPPQPLPFVTASFLSFLSAGIVCALGGLVPWDKLASGTIGVLGRMGSVAAASGLLSAILCGWSRSAGFFPSSGTWSILFESFGSFILGGFAGFVFTAIELFMKRRRPILEPSEV